MTRPTIAITCGEPAGVGPELSLRAAWQLRAEVGCVLLGDASFLSATAAAIDPAIQLAPLVPDAVRANGWPAPASVSGRIMVLDCPLAVQVVPGRIDPANGIATLRTLDLALEGVAKGWFGAMVTAPLQKSAINDAGVPFSGHTEYLAEKTGTSHVVMMLAGPTGGGRMLRVALATTHLPLRDVPAAITFDGLLRTLGIIERDLRLRFGLARPRILVAGLNPHAGEGGHLGREEIEVITPAIEAARARGMAVEGPFPADTLFQPKYLDRADCVLAMYHDQGLPVLKHACFGRGINITLGLPLVRTSVDHGTALDLAAGGPRRADPDALDCGSMLEAVRTAARMAARMPGGTADAGLARPDGRSTTSAPPNLNGPSNPTQSGTP